ncbi:Rieske (2Fe-2S) protein [Fibrella forsythiae]|uniref:Rieske 2Fe-2S domain-containing protein n=1 Tax=Fibrella forsythiae TaxID=2817061 RepID=A0ABS3JD15_9BACT|nr:Rieske 2Fe-2S domain-containing protein [Fibrella forsythiae]MBO0947338.1 Rieske 2Fe-2S domain-containing protein [Fibrella forsythiae]
MNIANQDTPTAAQQPYVVGKSYTVLVAVLASKWNGLRYVPIIGPKHADDKILNFPHEHYHIDWRFVSPAAYADATFCRSAGAEFGQVLHTEGEVNEVQAIQKRRMYCFRDFGTFPVHIPPWYDRLQQAYQKTTLGPKRLCPHQGADLSSVAPVDGAITCPLHGLKWCSHTGKLLVSQLKP